MSISSINSRVKYISSTYQNIHNVSVKFTMDDTSSLNESYRHEVMRHVTYDLDILKETFGIDENLSEVHIAHAGQETHYGGKKPLFLTFKLEQGSCVKLVYKPRSVAPEQILEQCASKISNRLPRKISDHVQYGYDTYIEGTTLNCKFHQLPQKLIIYGNQQQENLALLYALYYLGIEDTHPENFIIDRNGILHFIDAEVFQTGVSTNLNYLFDKDESSDEEFSKVDGYEPLPRLNKSSVLEKKLLDIVPQLKNNLQRTPTRLVICSTTHYTFPNSVTLRPWRAQINDCQFENLKDFNDFHTVYLAEFLAKLGKISINRSMSFTDVKQEVISAIGEEGLTKINEELVQSKKIRTEDLGELPSFRFHLLEEWIECPLSNQRVQIKR